MPEATYFPEKRRFSMTHSWQDVVLALIAAAPAIIAAISSVRNGRKIDSHNTEVQQKLDGAAKSPLNNGLQPRP
jgi:hypothetical protein